LVAEEPVEMTHRAALTALPTTLQALVVDTQEVLPELSTINMAPVGAVHTMVVSIR
jgi:hypothetical protein